VCFSPTEKIKIPSLKKRIKTPDTQANDRKAMNIKHSADLNFKPKADRTPACNSGLAKVASSFSVRQFFRKFEVRASYESSVVKSPPSPSRKTLLVMG
jgi:hypothetical protein